MIKKMKSDKEVNDKKYWVYMPGGTKEERRCADLKVGDIILMKKGDRTPADCVLLATNNQKSIFIRTD
jgi:magnesium-transporting ATPase (P-type)